MTKEVGLARRPDGKFDVSDGTSQGHSEATYPVLDFPAGTGPQLIVFQLASGPEKFSQNDPIWVSATSKPQGPATHPQIIDAKVFDNGKTLVVLNKNSEDVDLYYNLNMVSGGGAALKLDPVITNGGGGSGIDWASYAIIGAVAGALLAVLFVRFAMGWRSIKP